MDTEKFSCWRALWLMCIDDEPEHRRKDVWRFDYDLKIWRRNEIS